MNGGKLLASATAGTAIAHVALTAGAIAGLPPMTRAANIALLVVEATLLGFAALLFLSLREPSIPTGTAPRTPVDVLIPVRNESAAVLERTLVAASALRHPDDVRVLVIDDSDPAQRTAIERTCAAMGVTVLARSTRRGYKAGALNDALASTSAPFVAVLDVDHAPSPDLLEHALQRFAPGVAFVQTILAWRNEDSLLRRLAGLLQHQFYYGVQMDKGSRERAVFTGSAAVFRREALADVGGFPEETLVEDFDITLRLTNAGWRGRLAPEVGAHGLLPWTAGDLARQLWRWSSGTTSVIRKRLRETLRARNAPLVPRIELLVDGCAYLAGGAFVAAALLLVAMGLAGVPLVRPLAGWSILLAPAAIALAHMTSAAIAMRRKGDHAYAILPLYHLVSLAFTPVLLASALGAWMGLGGAVQGRVTKTQGAHQSPIRGAAMASAVAVSFGALAIGTAAIGALPLPAAGWVGLLGASFLGVVVTTFPTRTPT